MAIITGTTLQDLLFGTASSDTIDGLQDNDTIFGRGGLDIINGGGGNDLASGDEGDDQVNGDAGDDTLLGGEGNDTVNGGAGNDVIDGGAGNDNLGGDANNDTILGGAGNDTLNGDDGDDVLDGGLGVNTVSGGLGDDKIYSFSGTDLLRGQEENDTYFFADDGAARTVTVEDLDGFNTFDLGLAFPGASIDLRGANVSTVGNTQILRAAGTVILNVLGTDFGDSIWGDNLSNFIDGRAGGDYMEGGLGDDTYRVDSQFDTVVEAAAGGVDTIETTVSLTLRDVQEIETLVLLGTDNLTGEGNGIANSIVGNTGNNTIDGLGGDDVMIGGAGNDAYYLDSSLDIIAESAGEGTDTAFAGQNYTLADNVENLVLLGGALNLTGNGNSLNNVITGNEGNNQINGFGGADTMAGGLGNDTYVVDNLNDIVTEAANAGDDTVQSSISYTLAANVERLELLTNNALTGTGNIRNNTLIGNNAFNTLSGGSGNDVLDGRGGGDNMIGGIGNDSYVVDNAADFAFELFNEGIDSVTSSVSFTLGADVENLTLTGTAANGTGNTLANRITGNNSANTLTGGDGNDTLDGGLGTDTMDGGDGADTYFVERGSDVIIEAASAGIDTVNSSVTRTLEAEVERLFLTGTANIHGTGNALDNRLVGNSGNNNLLGRGGADTMIGGLGNDFYEVDDLGDVVTELAGQGVDGVNASITYFLPNYVEILQLLNGGAAANGFGNSLDNELYGNDADNLLDGKTGVDRMLGGLGDDNYMVDNLGDTVVENAGQGYDAVSSSVTFTLGANIEQLNLIGNGVKDGTGNNLNNVINGNGAANILNGMTGADTMTGGSGNDVYIVDNAGDVVVEIAGAGTGLADRVESSISYTLVFNVENLTLTGAANRNGTGNAGNNQITGNAGNNTLTGAAGLDTLTGNLGLDRFAFANTGLGTDTITDFNTADDLIQVSAAGFGGGLVASGAVVLQSGATPTVVGGAGQFLYDTDTGFLSYDADGTGAGVAVQFARLTNLAPITALDFVVVP